MTVDVNKIVKDADQALKGLEQNGLGYAVDKKTLVASALSTAIALDSATPKVKVEGGHIDSVGRVDDTVQISGYVTT